MTIVQPVMRPFEPLLGWECGYVCHNVRAEEEGIYGRKPEYKTSNWYTNDPHLGKQAAKRTFLIKISLLFGRLMPIF